jgi:cyclophilin family peptidyl-prolyl cis-trans isomerase
VERIKKLAQSGKYDGVAFHRVIDGFMAQTGDVEFGNVKDFSNSRVGTGGSDLPDLKEEFNDKKHLRGTCSMARSASPNSANSQFFICFEPSSFLDRQYTVWGQVIEGMDFVDKIKMGSSRDNGSVTDPDHMIKVTVGRPAEDKKDSEKK